MNNAIKILLIIALILSSLGLLLAVFVLTIFWQPLNLLLKSSSFIIGTGPIVPIGSAIDIFGCVLTMAFLLISVKSKRDIIIEILAIIFLGIVLPVIVDSVEIVQKIWVARYLGEVAMATLNVEATLIALPSQLVSISSWLCFLACGMRIAQKIYFKKQKSNQG